MNDLAALDEYGDIIAGLISDLSPSGRTALMKKVARDWAKSQSRRIGAQKNPDGTAFVPRKPNRIRDQRDKKRRRTLRQQAMFKKLRTRRFLKSGANANEAWVGFIGGIVRIARVHQEGLKDRAEKDAPEVEYPRRELLGLSDHEYDDLLDLVMEHFEH